MASVGPIVLAINRKTGMPTSSEKKYSLIVHLDFFHAGDSTLKVAAAPDIASSSSKNNCV